MKWIKLFEKFGEAKYKIQDIILCINKGGLIFTNIVENFPDHKYSEPLKPLSIDDEGNITVIIDSKEYNVDLEDVEKIDFYNGKDQKNF